MKLPESIAVIDSHTEGEPTRVVVEGWPAPAGTDMAARREHVRDRFDELRAAVVREPRGHEAVVGALLTDPVSEGAEAGVIFFNNVGYLGMCGHGLIGVVRTLQHLGRITPGSITIDTPVGPVEAQLANDGAVTIRNVVSYCHALDVRLDVPGVGPVTGDIAYGGNWFFITDAPGVDIHLSNIDELMRVTRAIQHTINDREVCGSAGAHIDHVELTVPSRRVGVHARNFVLCPGGEYDRSPCGTGTSATLAVLHARGELAPGSVWRQESVTGGVFDAWFDLHDDGVVPFIRGRAFITAEAVLRFDSKDPFRHGFPAR